MCGARVQVVPTRAGVCLLMADIEPLKPTNTGWLMADVVADTFAFGWARTEVDPALLALLDDRAVAAVRRLSGRVRGARARRARRTPARMAKPVGARCSSCWTPPGTRPARCFARARTWIASRC
jgi:hypothetical protein